MTARRLLVLALKLTIVALVVWFLFRTVRQSWEDLSAQSWKADPLWLLLAGALYLLGVAPCGVFWRRALEAFGQRPPLLRTLRAYYIGHLGKYVPGKALVVVMRAGLISGDRVNPTVATVSVFYETLTAMAVGAFLAAAILAVGFRDRWELALLSAAMILPALLPTLPFAFRRIVRLVGIGQSDPKLADRIGTMPTSALIWGWGTIAAGWFAVGGSLWATLEAMGVVGLEPLAQLPLFTAAVCLATVAGFLSFIPGGVLVRESVLVALLAEPFGKAQALIAAVLLRLVWLAAEAAISAVLYWMGAPAAAQPDAGS